MNTGKWLHKKPETILDWLVITCTAILFFVLASNFQPVVHALNGMLAILSPFAGGIVIAYAINPIVTWVMRNIFRNNPKCHGWAMLIGFIVALVVFIALIWLLVSQVWSSLLTLYNELPGYTRNLVVLLESLNAKYESVDLSYIIDQVKDFSSILSSLGSMLLNRIPEIMEYFGNMASNFVSILTAVASSVYLLNQKDRLLRHARIVTRAFFSPNVAERVMQVCHNANRNFGGFFSGKILDSLIIGLITFLAMLALRLSYAPLISIIVGITNIIPVFGPFIGAIPGVIILLFLDPVQALIFLVLILIIQQLDGNIIGPKILGNSIGISALWVLFAIVVGGELFGLVGMVIGVPVFATLYGLMRELVEYFLLHRGIDHEGRPLKPSPAEAAQTPEIVPVQKATSGGVDKPNKARRGGRR